MALCFRDLTFCSASARCATKTCDRNFTDDLHEMARKWWSHDPDNAPVAFSDLSGRCGMFKEIK